VRVALADENRTALFKPIDRTGGPARNVVAIEDRAMRRADAGGVEYVLGGERNAVERAAPISCSASFAADSACSAKTVMKAR
jgi:hypothetical protein